MFEKPRIETNISGKMSLIWDFPSIAMRLVLTFYPNGEKAWAWIDADTTVLGSGELPGELSWLFPPQSVEYPPPQECSSKEPFVAPTQRRMNALEKRVERLLERIEQLEQSMQCQKTNALAKQRSFVEDVTNTLAFHKAVTEAVNTQLIHTAEYLRNRWKEE